MAYNAQSDDDYDAKEFVKLVMEDQWDKVIEKYKEDAIYHNIKIKGKGTALHVAISNQCKAEVSSLVEAILNKDNERCLKIKNERGDTPLHLAAYRGYIEMCELIIGKEAERKYLIQIENKKEETPLFCAVLGDQKIVFDYLQELCPLDLNFAFDKNGTRILHVAIEREMFDLANRILFCYESLGYSKDKNDVTPLGILATRTSAFKSGNRLSWWKEILYYCFTLSVYDETTVLELNHQKEISKETAKNEKSSSQVNITLYNGEPLEKEYKIRDYLAQSCRRIQQFLFKRSILHLLDLKAAIETIKNNHKLGHELLEKLMEHSTYAYMGGRGNPADDGIEYDGEMEDEFKEIQKFTKRKPTDAYMGSGDNPVDDDIEYDGEMDEEFKEFQELKKFQEFIKRKREGGDALKRETKDLNSDKKYLLPATMNTPYLIAASHGIVEIMSKLQLKIKSVINETNSNNENVLLLAVKYRQPHVIEMLMKSLPLGVFHHLHLQIDKNGNTMLHLAADTSFQREDSWMISGAAMQMMWDIKWYKYIKGLVPKHFKNRGNNEGETPSEIFKTRRKDLLRSSVEWLKETMTSCSVVASLIAGVAFATIGSVPGGNKETGEPALQGKLAFEGFAISSLIGLYFSVTALMMFLAILTSRKEIEDFRKTLPMKLLFGLSSLFVSIVAMFVSFSAGHFSILTDKYTKGGILFYLYVSICLSVAFYAIVQFTLLVDLINVIWNRVPPPTVKGVHL